MSTRRCSPLPGYDVMAIPISFGWQAFDPGAFDTGAPKSFDPDSFDALAFDCDGAAHSGSTVRVWSGVQWDERPIYRWNGASFEPATAKRWNGTAWV